MRVLVAETTWATSTVAHDLEREGFLVTRANDGEELLLYIRDAVQDAVVIDASLGDITPERAIRSLRMVCPAVPVVVMAVGSDREARRSLFAAGADDVEKAQPEARELAARIRSLVRRTSGYSAPVATLGAIAVDFEARRVTVGGVSVLLTPTEYELVEHLTLRRRHVVSRDRIMTHLYVLGDAPDPSVLDVHTTRIRRKLGAAGADPDQFHTLNGRGFCLDGRRADPEAA